MENQKKLVKYLLSIRSSEQMMDFLTGILTPNELEEISTRLEIVKLLKKKVDHRTIASNLKVGIATVTRGSKELQNGKFKYV